MALEKIPADIRVTGGVARMSDPKIIKQIMEAVTIPVSYQMGTDCIFFFFFDYETCNGKVQNRSLCGSSNT